MKLEKERERERHENEGSEIGDREQERKNNQNDPMDHWAFVNIAPRYQLIKTLGDDINIMCRYRYINFEIYVIMSPNITSIYAYVFLNNNNKNK